MRAELVGAKQEQAWVNEDADRGSHLVLVSSTFLTGRRSDMAA